MSKGPDWSWLKTRSLPATIWRQPDFASLSTAARLLEIGLRNFADDCGVFEWRPTAIHILLRPAERNDTAARLDEIATSGRIMRFRHDGADYGALRHFCAEQRLRWRVRRCPMPDDVATFVAFDGKAGGIGSPSRSSGDWGRLRRLVFERDGECCAYCGTTVGPFHVDHKLAVARGGTNDPDNLTVACRGCNLSKGPRDLEEWLAGGRA